MVDPIATSTDLRVKNKLEKQDEIEVSDEEEVGGLVNSQRRRSTKKIFPEPVLPSMPKSGDKLTKQASAPVNSDRTKLAPHVLAENADCQQMRKSSVPLAYVHIPESGSMQMRNELTAPRHLGSMAFSSMSTEESSIADIDALGRQMGILSVQGSLQDDLYGSDRKKMDDFASPAEFLINTWHTTPRDRQNLLNFEKILENMLNTKGEGKYVSPTLNSYYRMLLHQMADVWGFEHSPDMSRGEKVVLVKVLPDSRRPDQLFRDMVDRPIPEEPSNFGILKRPKNQSLPEASHAPLPRAIATMSFEERQANYDRVRQQIFSQEDSGNDGDETPQPYGLSQNCDVGNFQAQAAYNRSRSVLSDVSSDTNYDSQAGQMRPTYGESYGHSLVRPMIPTPSLYGNPYGYAAGLIGYSASDGSYMDPALYQQMVMASQQQHFYQGFAHPGQYHPAQQSMYSGVAFAQPGFPHPAYSPQGSFDQMQQQFDPLSQYAYQQQQHYSQAVGDATGMMPVANVPQYTSPPMPVDQHSVRQPRSPAQGYISPGERPHQTAVRPILASMPQPRFSNGNGNHQLDYNAESQGALNDAFIIPLRFPPVGGSSQASAAPLGMYLKLPFVRASGGPGGIDHNGGEHFRRVSRHNSGRSSVDRQNSAPSPGFSSSSGPASGKHGDYAGPSVVPELGGDGTGGGGCGSGSGSGSDLKEQCSRN